MEDIERVSVPPSGFPIGKALANFLSLSGNKSEEYPSGVLNKDVLKSFMSITGEEDNLQWTFGHERIPEVSLDLTEHSRQTLTIVQNWYKRNKADEYSVQYCKSSSTPTHFIHF